MAFGYIIPLRIVQAVLALTVLIAAAVFVSRDVSGAAEGSFMVFNPIFTWVVLVYLVGAPIWLPSIHNEWVVLGIEAVTWVLWLAGFAAMAARIPSYVCLDTLTALCGGIAGGKAAAVLGAFEWIAFSITLALTIYNIVQNHRKDGGDVTEGAYMMTPPPMQYADDFGGTTAQPEGVYTQPQWDAPPQAMHPGYPQQQPMQPEYPQQQPMQHPEYPQQQPMQHPEYSQQQPPQGYGQ